jgi:predicted DNA-binding protein (MmcQ/YjbR family)
LFPSKDISAAFGTGREKNMSGTRERAPKPPSLAERLRAICLALPGAEEVVIRRGPTFRVGEKIFALDRTVDGRASVWFKAPAGAQSLLTGVDPDLYFSPPYYGSKGWVGMRLDRATDWDEVAARIERSHRLVAPRRAPTR